MATRSVFAEIRPLSSAKNGANNRGVYLVKSLRSGKKYIEKRIGTTAIESGHAEREVQAMKQCTGHPNIVQIKDWDLDYSHFLYGSIFMQRCELGSLDLLIDRYSRRDRHLEDEGFLFKVFWDLSLALCYMRTGSDVVTTRNRAAAGKSAYKVDGWNPMCHRDLKPGNLFLTWDDSLRADKCVYPTVVIGDFGCNVTDADVRAGRAKPYHHSGVTPCFAPPESPEWHSRGDVYALGLIMHCLGRMRNTPRSPRTDVERHPLPRVYENINLHSGVKNCLHPDPDRRPAAKDLPMKVWTSYKAWRKTRRDDGAELPSWAWE